MRNNNYNKQLKRIFRHRVLATCALLATFAFATDVAFAAAGDLDSSFDFNGKLRTGVASREEQAYAITVQPDGKILAAGMSYSVSTGIPQETGFLVVRYNSNGSLDQTFGEISSNNGSSINRSGSTRVEFGVGLAVVKTITVLSNGKILVAGTSKLSESNQNFAVARLNSNGDLDTTFGSAGRAEIDFGSTASPRVDSCNAMVVQNNGKIILVGSTSADGGGEYGDPSSDLAAARLNANGTLDNTFDLNGKLRTDYAGQEDQAYSVALQDSGKIVVVGSVSFGGGTDFVVARYNSNGSLDTTFREPGFTTDRSGFVRADFGAFGSGASANSVARAVKIQSDGKIVVAGTANINSPNPGLSNFALFRLNPDGSLDDTFFTFYPGSRVQTDFGNEKQFSTDEAFAMEIQSNGKILVAGASRFQSGNNGFISLARNDFALARYNANGSLDNTFDSNGKLKTDLSADYDQAHAIALQPDGKIVLAGEGFFSDTKSLDFALARYLAQ